MNSRPKVIAVDFDGTLIKDGFPDVREGTPNVNLFKELIALQKKGNKIILWTCRDGKPLLEAIEFCHQNGLILDKVNENIPEVLKALDFDHEPRKIFADIYIDDQSIKPKWGKE